MRYEAANYFITPEVLRAHVIAHYRDLPLFLSPTEVTAEEILDTLIMERIFGGREENLATWKAAAPDAARLLWDASTEWVKISDVAEEFFRRLAYRLWNTMLLRKGELRRLVGYVHPESIAAEVG